MAPIGVKLGGCGTSRKRGGDENGGQERDDAAVVGVHGRLNNRLDARI